MKNKLNVGPVPTSVQEFVKLYPNVARKLAATTNVEEWNAVREDIKYLVHPVIVNFVDTNGMIKKRQILKHFINQLDN